MCILVPCRKKLTIEQIEQIAEMFFQNVWIHSWLRTSIISYQDSRFMGELWSTLWGLMDTELKKSTNFHPQTNGQTEVANRIVVHLLKGYCRKHPKLWDESLHYVQHAYNRALHSSTGRSPFEMCFGYLPNSPMDFMFGEEAKEYGHKDFDKAIKFIQRIQKIHEAVQDQLEKSHTKYKMRHDKH